MSTIEDREVLFAAAARLPTGSPVTGGARGFDMWDYARRLNAIEASGGEAAIKARADAVRAGNEQAADLTRNFVMPQAPNPTASGFRFDASGNVLAAPSPPPTRIPEPETPAQPEVPPPAPDATTIFRARQQAALSSGDMVSYYNLRIDDLNNQLAAADPNDPFTRKDLLAALDKAEDNLRQARQDARKPVGPAGPSAESLALMRAQTAATLAQLTGEYNGAPTFAAQQAAQAQANQEQQRQDALKQRREAWFKSQLDSLMASGQHFGPAGTTYAGSDIPVVAPPSAELLYRAFGGNIPLGGAPPVPTMLGGLASLDQRVS